MFDIGFLELIIVAVLALLVLGPERLPKAAHTVGKWVGRARRVVSSFSQEVDRQLEIETLREQLKKEGESVNINDDANKIHQTVSDALAEANKQIGEFSMPSLNESFPDQTPKAEESQTSERDQETIESPSNNDR